MMVVPGSVRVLVATLLLLSVTAGRLGAAPTSPGGSETLPYRDPCENIGKYFNADYDRDGLSGYQECQLGSDPHDADTDGYGDFPDGAEVAAGTDPTNWDTDGDQLGDCWEIAAANAGIRTDPISGGLDSDGDGIADALEITYGLNPNSTDTDQDMVSDGDEFLPLGLCNPGNVEAEVHASYAIDPDYDDDGLDDGVENSIGTGWDVYDTDNDGYSDGEEVLKWGSDPTDSNDPSPNNPPDYHP